MSRGVPRTAREIGAAAASLGLHIPDACMPGVMANLALLDRHASQLPDQTPEQGGGKGA